MSITIKDFYPINDWTLDADGDQWDGSYESRFIVDSNTGKLYLNEDQETVRTKSTLLALGTPFVHSITTICFVVYRMLKLITLCHFWVGKEEERSYNFKNRLQDAGIDLLKMVATPLALVGLELSAIYGIFRPYDGRKLYATIERAEYGDGILAPCFQPEPTHHAFGGDIDERNAF